MDRTLDYSVQFNWQLRFCPLLNPSFKLGTQTSALTLSAILLGSICCQTSDSLILEPTCLLPQVVEYLPGWADPCSWLSRSFFLSSTSFSYLSGLSVALSTCCNMNYASSLGPRPYLLAFLISYLAHILAGLTVLEVWLMVDL